MSNALKAGEFTGLAGDYSQHRPDYCPSVVHALLGLLDKPIAEVDFVDVGAGTGIWTRMIQAVGVRSATAIEPNDDMRQNGITDSQHTDIRWLSGSAEATGLEDSSADWLTMASSFHWANFETATAEFHRVLRAGGRFTALWNPRLIEVNPLLVEIEAHLEKLRPNIKRVSSGRSGITETLTEQFSLHDEFAVTEAATAAAGIKAIKADNADLVILDVNLPDMDGREACKIIRKNGYKGPVILLTAQSSEADTILGLDAGANDYVTKPFRFAVLLARIRAHLRQHEHSEDATFKVGPYTFKPSAKLLLRDDNRKIRLTEKETAIIKFLLRSGEQIVGRDVLLQDVWGYNAGVTTHTLETHVYRLRQKIERDPSHAEILVTEGGGYKLVP